jgi:hypothetical protein
MFKKIRTRRRVAKALKRYVKMQTKNPRVKLPSKFTPAQVRVNDKGEVQIRMNPANLGSGGRFAKCVKSVEARGGAYDPYAVCASAGRKKYGKKKMSSMAARGRRRSSNPKRYEVVGRYSRYDYPTLKQAKVAARAESRDEGYARIQIDGETILTFHDGRQD